jgi:hypothetical protein
MWSPALLLVGLLSPTALLTSAGREEHGGVAVDHVRYTKAFPELGTSWLARVRQTLSNVDLYFDANSHLLLFAVYQLHPDHDFSLDIPVEIRFADYRNVRGTAIPYRIQRVTNGSLNLDLIVDSASINSGLSDSDFALQ